MTTEQKLNEIYGIYKKVTMLADKNGCRTLRIRHKELNKDLCMHILDKPNAVYNVLCGIRNDALPEIYEVYTLDDGQIVLEEFIDGITVSDIANSGQIRKSGAVKIAKDVCTALNALHQNGIVHRDIKPENIMVDSCGQTRLIDFNVARMIAGKSQDTVILGTVGYAAPEQLGLAESDTRTDIYAMGVLLNVMLTGIHPSEHICKGLAGRIVRKCTDITPDKRYQSVKQLHKRLSFI